MTLRTEECDLTTRTWEQEAFDLVVAIFVHLSPAVRQSVHRSFRYALKPRELLILAAKTIIRRTASTGVTLFGRAAATGFPSEQEGTSHCGLAHVVRSLLRKPC
ncbi:MAG: hypothetical protein ACK421_08545 [Pseudanabaenaceae cyanobacterium]